MVAERYAAPGHHQADNHLLPVFAMVAAVTKAPKVIILDGLVSLKICGCDVKTLHPPVLSNQGQPWRQAALPYP
jgi:hypothetical protein